MTAEPERFSHRLPCYSTLLRTNRHTANERLFLFLMSGWFVICALTIAPTTNAQSCPPVAVDGGSTIAAGATINGTTQEVTPEMVVPKGTTLRLDAIATVAGECSSYVEQCNPSPCTCVFNSTYPRTINHISMWMDVTTSGALNGQYTVGYVYGLNPNGTTAFYPVLVRRRQTRPVPSTRP